MKDELKSEPITYPLSSYYRGLQNKVEMVQGQCWMRDTENVTSFNMVISGSTSKSLYYYKLK